MNYAYYLAAGGLGDVFRELLYHNALGILKRWKARNPGTYLKVVTMCHNPSHLDLFKGQAWINQVEPFPFQLDRSWAAEAFYDWYPRALDGFTELRWVSQDAFSQNRSDRLRLRGRPVPIVNIDPVGMAADLVLSAAELAVVKRWEGALVIHPFAGEQFRWIGSDLLRKIVGVAGERALVVGGGSYARPGHADEVLDGVTVHQFVPRVLLEIIKRAAGVVGAESSVYYAGAMYGRPVTMLYAPNSAFDLLARGQGQWDWFYGVNEPGNMFVPLAVDSSVVLDWVRRRLA